MSDSALSLAEVLIRRVDGRDEGHSGRMKMGGTDATSVHCCEVDILLGSGPPGRSVMRSERGRPFVY